MLIGLFRSRATLEAENLVLRQQISVLLRTAPKRLCAGGRQATNRGSLASCRVQSLLALEIEAALGKTEGPV
jgi:hypothetical protein